MCVVQQLLMEMTYSRYDHEAWLRGPGRADLEEARKELGQGAFTPEEFEEEVETQMELFDRCCAVLPYLLPCWAISLCSSLLTLLVCAHQRKNAIK